MDDFMLFFVEKDKTGKKKITDIDSQASVK